jgi:transposase-like protein
VLDLPSSTKTQKYPLWTVLPPELRHAHLNGCRTPGCRNFNVPPVVVPGVIDPNYRVERDGTDHRLRCSACGRRFSIFAVRAHALELDRLETRSGALVVPSCPRESCRSFGKPVTRHPRLYRVSGSTSSGRKRYRCRTCGSSFVFEDDHKALINKRIFQTLIRFLMNAVAIRGQMRMTQRQAAEIYRRLPYIWRKFVQYEEYKLQRFFAMKKNRHIRLHLSVDAQDQLVNWWSRDRRDPVQLSCITTAENLSGFILRTDLNFEGSTGNAAEHFEELLLAGDYGLPKAMSLHERYEEKAFLKAVIWGLRRAKKGLAPSDRRKSTTATPLAINSQRRQMINKLLFQAEQQLKTAVPGVVDDVEGSPPDGVIVKRPYTALAHLAALDRLLPEEARIHLSTDRDGTLVAAALTAFRDRIVANTLNMTVVTFAREMTIDQKVARIARFNQRLDAFVRLHGLQDADPILVRQAFIATYARKLKPLSGIPGTFCSVPVQTPYEPDKRVGIVHARLRSTTASQTWQQWELLV